MSRLVDEVFAGRYSSLFKGRGVEFAEVREYLPGDDVRSIDWNVTARSGHPFVKKNAEERELTLMLVVDVSGSLEFGSAARSKRELASELGAILAFSALRNQDKVGLLSFSDRVERFLPPRKGRSHSLGLIREILEPAPQGRGTDLEGALAYLNRVQRRRAVVFLLSDLLGPPPGRALRVTRRRHDLSVLRLWDPREEEIPPVGRLRLRDLETGARALVDTSSPSFRRRFREEALADRQALRGAFERAGVDYGEFSTSGDLVSALIRFFADKQARHRYDRRRL